MRNISTLTYLIKRCLSSSVINGEMKYLNVAEKHDAAKTIAGFLSRGSARRREGYSVYNKIFDFEANVGGQNAKMVMTSVSGHLLNYEFLMSYKNWQSCDPQQLFDAPIRKSCTEDGEKIKRTLEREVKSCQGLIVWTDCDREGENIGFEIIQVCKAIKPNLVVYRAKFSEITATAVRRALANLIQPDKRQSDAVDVRQELDLRTGAAFTRFQTIRLQRIFPSHIADKLISYGSCQIPTLGFVARRYKEVEEFVSEPFWKIKVTHTIDDLTVEFHWDRNRLFDKEACEDYLMLCLAEPTATVVSVTTKPKNKWRPCPMDTVELEKLGSRKLKLAAKEVMTIAEKLYTQGIISYPRTETTIFSPDINLRSLVEQQTAHSQWGEFASRVLEWGPNPRKGNKSDQAHPPIHPIKFTTSLTGNEQRVYELIVRHFLACVSKDATGSETVVNITIAGEKFHATGLCIYERNYLDVYIYEKWNAKQIHRYENGQQFIPSEISMQDGCTAPPPLLTEADLIALMEKHGIGTDATHAEHIHKIKERGYIGEAERGFLVPGTIGMGLYEGYDAMELSLAYPMLRAEFESDLKKICSGEKDPNEVLREQIIKYKEAYRVFTEKIRALDEKVATRLNETIQGSNENSAQESNSNPPTNRIEELFTCPKCKKARMALKRKKDNTGFYLGCLNFPDCRNSVWFSDEISDISVTSNDQNYCNRCGPGYRMLKIKFKRNNYLILLNAVTTATNNSYQTCIGCDSKFREIFNINTDSVKNVGRIVGNDNENSSLERNTENERANVNSTRNNTTVRQQRNNTNRNSHQENITNSRTFSTNASSSTNDNCNQQRSTENSSRNNNNSRYRGWDFNNENSTSYSNDVGEQQPISDENFFDDDGFDELFIAQNLEVPIAVDSTESNNARNQDFSINNNSENRDFGLGSSGNQHNNIHHNSPGNWSKWSNWFNDSMTDSVENSTPSAAVDIPWGTRARATESNLRNNGNVVKCSGCNQPAKELTVKKDGPNKGRMFYKCPKLTGLCDFFIWSDDVAGQSNQNDNNSSRFGNNFNPRSIDTTSSVPQIMCNCQKPAKSLKVKKDGPNKGKTFYGCPDSSCRFFKWADENENSNGGQGDTWGSNSNAATTSWGTSSNSNSSEAQSSRERVSKRRKCGFCRQEGHTKLKCPRKEEFDL